MKVIVYTILREELSHFEFQVTSKGIYPGGGTVFVLLEKRDRGGLVIEWGWKFKWDKDSLL